MPYVLYNGHSAKQAMVREEGQKKFHRILELNYVPWKHKIPSGVITKDIVKQQKNTRKCMVPQT